jgi:hypothetical protein
VPRVKKAAVPLEESLESMRKIAFSSNGLWAHVNTRIFNVLEHGIKSGWTREEIADKIMEGVRKRERKNEPVCMANYREAARQLRRGELVSVL